MTTINIPDDQAAALRARAAAEGLSLQAWLKRLALEAASVQAKPKKSAYGLLAKYGPAPTEEEIDENRRDMLRGFAEDSGSSLE